MEAPEGWGLAPPEPEAGKTSEPLDAQAARHAKELSRQKLQQWQQEMRGAVTLQDQKPVASPPASSSASVDTQAVFLKQLQERQKSEDIEDCESSRRWRVESWLFLRVVSFFKDTLPLSLGKSGGFGHIFRTVPANPCPYPQDSLMTELGRQAAKPVSNVDSFTTFPHLKTKVTEVKSKEEVEDVQKCVESFREALSCQDEFLENLRRSLAGLTGNVNKRKADVLREKQKAAKKQKTEAARQAADLMRQQVAEASKDTSLAKIFKLDCFNLLLDFHAWASVSGSDTSHDRPWKLALPAEARQLLMDADPLKSTLLNFFSKFPASEAARKDSRAQAMLMPGSGYEAVDELFKKYLPKDELELKWAGAGGAGAPPLSLTRLHSSTMMYGYVSTLNSVDREPNFAGQLRLATHGEVLLLAAPFRALSEQLLDKNGNVGGDVWASLKFLTQACSLDLKKMRDAGHEVFGGIMKETRGPFKNKALTLADDMVLFS